MAARRESARLRADRNHDIVVAHRRSMAGVRAFRNTSRPQLPRLARVPADVPAPDRQSPRVVTAVTSHWVAALRRRRRRPKSCEPACQTSAGSLCSGALGGHVLPSARATLRPMVPMVACRSPRLESVGVSESTCHGHCARRCTCRTPRGRQSSVRCCLYVACRNIESVRR